MTSPPKAGSELFFGLVGAIGSDLSKVTAALVKALKDVGYRAESIHTIELLHQIEHYDKLLEESPLDKRYWTHMDQGDHFRRAMGRGDALAHLSIASVKGMRASLSDDAKGTTPIPNCAYIFKSFKHPDEVRLMRRVYGSSFYVIAAYSPRDTRYQRLLSEIAGSHYEMQRERFATIVHDLMQRDEYDADNDFGQRVRDCFPSADLFVDAGESRFLSGPLNRFVEL